MNFLLALIPTILVLGGLIIIHEFGHFIACRLTGVKVEKFSIGFGPELFHIQGPETRYVVSLFPLGGFVKPAGESVGELEEGSAPKKGDYLAASLPARIMIVTAGVIMNYFLAFVLFAIIFAMGRPVPGTTIGGFVDDYPAKVSELREGDKIVQINGQLIETWGELTETLQAASTEEVTLIVDRNEDGRVRSELIKIAPRNEEIKNIFGEATRVRRLGITPHPEANIFERYGVIESVGIAGQTVVTMTVMTHKAIFYLITGKMSPKTLAGPIGIISITGSASKLGMAYVLQLAATLSISLAVINLLPIPALDGGHLLFLLIEAVRRKSVSLEVQEKATQVGFMLLMALMVFVIYNDIVNLEVYDKVVGFFKGASS